MPTPTPPTHPERPGGPEVLDAAASLDALESQQRRTARALTPSPYGLYLPWGLGYLVAFGAAWLAGGDDVDAVSLEPRAEELRLRRLPGAVEALERDEHPPHPTVVSASARPGRDRPEEPRSDRL